MARDRDYEDDDRNDDRPSRDRDDERYDDEPGRDDPRDAIARAKKIVKTPAILLIIHAIVGLLGVAYGIVTIVSANPAEEFKKQRVIEENRPGLDANQKAALKQTYDMMEPAMELYSKALPALIGVGALSMILVLIGGFKLMNLSSPGFAKAACVLGIIPCLGGCCLIGIIGGFMGFSAMGKPDVKAAFALNAR